MKIEVIANNVVYDLITDLQSLVFTYIEQENRTNEVEEITENIYIFITLSNKHFAKLPQWNDVVLNVKRISEMKSKETKSLSSRAIFKYMDILDFLKKSV